MFHVDKDVRIDIAVACQFQEIGIDVIEIFSGLNYMFKVTQKNNNYNL